MIDVDQIWKPGARRVSLDSHLAKDHLPTMDEIGIEIHKEVTTESLPGQRVFYTLF